MAKKQKYVMEQADRLGPGSFSAVGRFDEHIKQEFTGQPGIEVDEHSVTFETGRAFAYLFRRFGYPRRGCDGDKDLVRYILTTPLPGMFLNIRLGGDDRSIAGWNLDFIERDAWRFSRRPSHQRVAAARAALAELKRPVFVRDVPIDFFGLCTNRRRSAEPAACSGWPSGALGTFDHEAVASIHGEVRRLGKGDIKLGLARAVEILKGAV